MKVFLKLKDSQTLVYPVDMAPNKKSAITLWEEGNFVEANIGRNEDPNTLSDKLVDGKVVWDETRITESKAFNDTLRAKRREMARTFRRTKAIHNNLEALDASVANKDWNDLTPFERKLLFKINGGPSDVELGIKSEDD